ncbi:hypothetical protein HNR06_001997 [Nocardiopsis arvandica]|uniref:Uncharacterized protein n=1 Tax=Nocardiopsis sinuspersici TaxID=501010 RepID=A0A7Y9XD93_9ACTN|nr:hypothetical protein [Nocardiopsis sinuspersici]NYH52408.1 hypothetical protein [Nocardiopsis sinuspersici]
MAPLLMRGLLIPLASLVPRVPLLTSGLLTRLVLRVPFFTCGPLVPLLMRGPLVPVVLLTLPVLRVSLVSPLR